MMKDCFSIDFETRGREDLKKVGAFRYAESAQIILVAIAWADEKPLIWDHSNPLGAESQKAWSRLQAAAVSGHPIYAHNAQFEQAITKYLWKQTFGFNPPKLEAWRCSAAMCRRAAIPSSLADAGEFLKLPQQKDKRGESLIRIFCCPRTNGKLKSQFILPTDEGEVTVAGTKMPIAEAWQLFREYCRLDVVAEQQITKLLAPFELKGEILEAFQFDARMNARGIPVNLEAIDKALKIVDDASRAEIARCRAICGFNPSQRGKVLEWLQARGYPADDLQEGTMDGVLANPPETLKPEALEVLQIRSRVSFSALAKLEAMKRAACSDGRVRGTFMWSGAIRTHRWSGKIIQPQNFKRPTIKDTHQCYHHICRGWDHEQIELLYGNPLEAVASCIRHFIQATDCEFLDADYSNIEARIVPWLAGQESLLDAFRRGVDPYVMMASKVFQKDMGEVTKDERFVGKQLILGAGYQLGWEKFQAMCLKYGRELDDELCKESISVYREENSDIASLWKAMQRAAVMAVENPGDKYKVRGKITFYMACKLPFRALLMRLPSGHHLVYPKPRLNTIWIFKKRKYTAKADATAAYERAKRKNELEEGERVWETKQIQFWGKLHMSNKWGWISTYGGSLTENCWAGETEILTPKGWIRIDQLGDELVWDGYEFVKHSGLKVTENISTILLDTLRVTPDHLVLTSRGWKKASEVNINEAYDCLQASSGPPRMADKRHNRESLREFDSPSRTAAGWFKTGEMALQMQMWGKKSADDLRLYKGEELLFTEVPHSCLQPRHSQHVQTPGLRCLAEYVRPVQATIPSGVAQLRWAWHNSLQKVAGIFSELLEGHGGFLSAWVEFGQEEQLQRVFKNELPLDYSEEAGAKYALQCQSEHSVGLHTSFGNSRAHRSGEIHGVLPLQRRSPGGRPVAEAGFPQPVYDIINCGPRHQYVARGANKRPVVAHNCTQAIAGDIMTHGSLEAQRQGYEVFMLVHDQCLSHYRPEKGHTVEGFRNALCKLPQWALDFPLEATCDIAEFYTKD